MASLYRAKIDAKNRGMQYVTDKYGSSFTNRNLSALQRATGRSPNRAKGQSVANKPPKPTGHYQYDGINMAFQDGGEAPVEQDMTGVTPYTPGMSLNLENDSELAQGSHTQWAQPTSVSHLITSLLRESQSSSGNFWETWSANSGGNVALSGRESSPFGVEVSYTPGQSVPTGTGEQQMSYAATNPYGGFGTNNVMQEEGEDPTSTTSTPTPTNPGTGLPTPDIGDPSNSVYNPWGFGSGADNNAYGPSQQQMSQATMEAMGLANAYFAPQRLELAYELGDMETDMRRLAVNLGRQVDDPTMQAKLYKESMRAVRTLDVQQNTLAFQMAEQRRREEMQNFQYYDALAQEEFKLRWQNQQFYDDLGLKSAYFDLENSIGMSQPYTSSTTTTGTPTPGSSTQSETRDPFSLKGIYDSMNLYGKGSLQGY